MENNISQYFQLIRLILFWVFIFGILLGIKNSKRRLKSLLLSAILMPFIYSFSMGHISPFYENIGMAGKLIMIILLPLILVFIIARLLGKGVGDAVIGNFVFSVIKFILLLPFRVLLFPFRIIRRR